MNKRRTGIVDKLKRLLQDLKGLAEAESLGVDTLLGRWEDCYMTALYFTEHGHPSRNTREKWCKLLRQCVDELERIKAIEPGQKELMLDDVNALQHQGLWVDRG